MKNQLSQKLLRRLAWPAAIVLLGIVITMYYINTKPKSKRQPTPRQARLVETVCLSPSDTTIIIKAMGTIVPACQIELKPQVSGKIIKMSPDLIPGGIFRKGRTLMNIDPEDYRLALLQAENELADAQSNLEIEQGNQAVARQEYSLLSDKVTKTDKELVLRKPQLITARSKLETAQAKLEQAKLNLQRTVITAPFNAVINMKHVDLGQMVSQSTILMCLTGTDEYWIEAAVPVSELKWITVPQDSNNHGSKVKIYNPTVWPAEAFRTGRVIRLQPDLETSGRMAKLIILADDPLLLKSKDKSARKLLLGSYVRVEILGKTIKSAYSIDRSLVHNGNVWLFGKDKTLKIRPIKILYKDMHHMIVSDGIDDGDKIITTDLSAPVEGMLLRTLPQNPLPDYSAEKKTKNRRL